MVLRPGRSSHVDFVRYSIDGLPIAWIKIYNDALVEARYLD